MWAELIRKEVPVSKWSEIIGLKCQKWLQQYRTKAARREPCGLYWASHTNMSKCFVQIKRNESFGLYSLSKGSVRIRPRGPSAPNLSPRCKK